MSNKDTKESKINIQIDVESIARQVEDQIKQKAIQDSIYDEFKKSRIRRKEVADGEMSWRFFVFVLFIVIMGIALLVHTLATNPESVLGVLLAPFLIGGIIFFIIIIGGGSGNRRNRDYM